LIEEGELIPKVPTEKQMNSRSRALAAKFAKGYLMDYVYPDLKEMYYKTLLTSTQEKEILDTLSQMRTLENMKTMLDKDLKHLSTFEKENMSLGRI